MIDLPSQQVQLVVVDILFVLLALGILMWFRSWLRLQTRRLDSRFEALDASLKQLTQVQERLQGVCRTLSTADPRSRGRRSVPRDDQPPVADAVFDAGIEGMVPSPDPGVRPSSESATSRASIGSPARSTSARVGSERGRSSDARQHETYERARQLLSKGISTDEVARMVDLGVAEVEVLKRMGELARSSSR